MNFRELRRGMIVLSNTIKKLEGSRELSLSNTNVQTAMMWTGTYMKFSKLGDNPYAKHDGNRKTVADIEPMFDATNDTFTKDILDKGAIYTIDQMRTYLGEQIEAIIAFTISEDSNYDVELTKSEEVQADLCVLWIHKHLTEARMWLGMELGRIRDNS